MTVRTPSAERLRAELTAAGIHTAPAANPTLLQVVGADPADVGRIAHRTGIQLWELAAATSDLEETFLALTDGTTVPRPTTAKAP